MQVKITSVTERRNQPFWCITSVRVSGRVLVLFNDQRGHVVGGEKVAGDGLEFFGSDGVDALVEGLEVPLMSMM